MPWKKEPYIRAIVQRCWPDYLVLVVLFVFLILLREVVTGNRRPFTPVRFAVYQQMCRSGQSHQHGSTSSQKQAH